MKNYSSWILLFDNYYNDQILEKKSMEGELGLPEHIFKNFS